MKRAKHRWPASPEASHQGPGRVSQGPLRHLHDFPAYLKHPKAAPYFLKSESSQSLTRWAVLLGSKKEVRGARGSVGRWVTVSRQSPGLSTGPSRAGGLGLLHRRVAGREWSAAASGVACSGRSGSSQCPRWCCVLRCCDNVPQGGWRRKQKCIQLQVLEAGQLIQVWTGLFRLEAQGRGDRFLGCPLAPPGGCTPLSLSSSCDAPLCTISLSSSPFSSRTQSVGCGTTQVTQEG